MEYRVIEFFTDLQDNNYAYHVGDTFPHAGMDVSPSRIAELAGKNNKRGIPLIESVATKLVDEPVKSEPKKRRSKKNVKDTD